MLDEANETFVVNLSNPVNAAIATAQGTGTIVDDDSPPVTCTKIAAAGDIACDPGSSSFNNGQGSALNCRQLAKSDLLVGAGYAAVLLLGDIQYEDGAYSKFLDSYDKSWGRVKSITKPAPGNHEYQSGNADGYYQYFGAAAGDPAKGYYSYDLGGWHMVALNSNCSFVGGCETLKLMKTVSAVMTETTVNPASSRRATFCGSVTMTASTPSDRSS